MKFMKWRILIITIAVCLAAILPGIALWNKLPDTMAIHFDINGQPDNFASKAFCVFGIPCLMALLQIICCIINDINAKKHGDRKKLETATKWIIPVMTVILQLATLSYGLGFDIDIRIVAAFIVGCIFIVIGNYLPKFGSLNTEDADKVRKINRFIAYESIAMGLLFLASIFLPPVFTLVCLFLLIPYATVAVIYGIYVGKK